MGPTRRSGLGTCHELLFGQVQQLQRDPGAAAAAAGAFGRGESGMRPAPPHILMTADTLGGVWTFAMDLCAGLAKREVRVTLVTLGRKPDKIQSAEAAALSNLELVPTGFRLEWMDGCESDVVASGEFILRLAQQIKPDLVHANGYYHAALPFDVPVLLTAHSCVTS